MRNPYFPFFICFTLFIGCEPRKDSTNGDLRTKNDTNTIGNWSKEFKYSFLQGCIGKASKTVSASDAFSYCNCITEKIEAKYPNQTEVNEKINDADIVSMKPDCFALSSIPENSNDNQSGNKYNNNTLQEWSSSDQRSFIENCLPDATKGFGKEGASIYCSCVMNKLMIEASNIQILKNVSKIRMSELARQCIEDYQLIQ